LTKIPEAQVHYNVFCRLYYWQRIKTIPWRQQIAMLAKPMNRD
jgi:hypothetical protein